MLSYYCLPLPSLCKTTHRHWIHINVCRVSCGCVWHTASPIDYLLFSLQLYGVVCVQVAHFSIGDWKDISIAHAIIIIKSEVSTFPIVIIFAVVVCLRCLLHHILSLIPYTFRENREFVFIIIEQFMMSANSRIRFGLQIVLICLYSTPSHYHHCANLSEDIELIKCLSDIFCRVCKIKHILSVIHYTIHYTICGAVRFQFTHSPCDDWENIYTLPYYLHQIGSMNYYPLFRVRSWDNGVRCMPFYILMWLNTCSLTRSTYSR